jgi:hypothetical protein
MFHKSEMQGNPGNPGADRGELYSQLRIDARRVAADCRNEQHTLAQNAVVPQVVRQGERYARSAGREDRGGPREAEGRVLEHPFDELALALPHPDALLLEQPVPGSRTSAPFLASALGGASPRIPEVRM